MTVGYSTSENGFGLKGQRLTLELELTVMRRGFEVSNSDVFYSCFVLWCMDLGAKRERDLANQCDSTWKGEPASFLQAKRHI